MRGNVWEYVLQMFRVRLYVQLAGVHEGTYTTSSLRPCSSCCLRTPSPALPHPALYASSHIGTDLRLPASHTLSPFPSAAPNLLSYFYDQCRDLSTGVLRPNHWADLGTHLVLQVRGEG